jgi:thioredoxin reductase (NADPH)
VGGANSAGQAAVFLAQCQRCTVHILVRGDSIETRMSNYLVKQIANTPNIVVHTHAEVQAVDGDSKLESLILTENGVSNIVPADGLFILIGAQPKTNWLKGILEREPHGFILTGGDLTDAARELFVKECGRQPLANETSMPFVFAAGDIRSGSTKRVAAAAGEGSNIAPQIHRGIALRTQ